MTWSVDARLGSLVRAFVRFGCPARLEGRAVPRPGLPPSGSSPGRANLRRAGLSLSILGIATAAPAFAAPIKVTTDNFVRAESDLFIGGIVKAGAFEAWDHTREPSPLDKQTVIRLNRDTLYSALVLDLDAGPAKITLPDTGGRFISAQVINEDHFTPVVHYEPGTLELTREAVGTRYVLVGIRILVDPNDPEDVKVVQGLQDQLNVEHAGGGAFEVPEWDQGSQTAVRTHLLALAGMLPDTRGMFGTKDAVDPVRHLLGAAFAWGGNPEKDALYLNVQPERNDGGTVYRMDVGQVPVQGFWSVTVYDKDGYYQPNSQNAYSLNNITVQRGESGTATIQFGGCEEGVPNCLPITEGWNYMVRLYRPEASILDGSWTFPVAEVAE